MLLSNSDPKRSLLGMLDKILSLPSIDRVWTGSSGNDKLPIVMIETIIVRTQL